MLNDSVKRELLNSAVTNRTDKTHATDKRTPLFDMKKAPIKYSIFEMMEGANEKRFVAFNDMPMASSKYERE